MSTKLEKKQLQIQKGMKKSFTNLMKDKFSYKMSKPKKLFMKNTYKYNSIKENKKLNKNSLLQRQRAIKNQKKKKKKKIVRK